MSARGVITRMFARARTKRTTCNLLFLSALLFLGPPRAITAQEAGVVAVVNVTVIPMDGERTLPSHTVVVEGGRIVAVGPVEEVAAPAEAKVIDGDGAFLMPGLADMHAHLNVDPSPDFMRLFLAEGVTTIRNLNADASHLGWRDEVLRGERVGPTIYSSGPVIVGPPDPSFVWAFRAYILGSLFALGALVAISLWRMGRVRGDQLRRVILLIAVGVVALGAAVIWTKVIPINVYTSHAYPWAYVPDTEARARAEVRRQFELGYDLIKVYDYLTRDQYLGVINEARIQGIYVVGHLDHGIEDPLATGLREVVHVDEFLDAHLIADSSPHSFAPSPIDLERIPESVALVATHDAFVVANMAMDVVTYEYLEKGPRYFDRPQYACIRPETIEAWRVGRMVAWQGQEDWRRNSVRPFLESMIRSLHAAGVLILTGTDTGEQGGLPEHIHRELELLVGAGLSPYEALSATTTNAHASVNRMGIDDAFGQVAVGQRADLILLRSNPLVNVAATRSRIGVMSRGRWYTQEQLDELVRELVATY